MPAWLSGLAAGGLSLLGARSSMRHSAREAQKNRDFQERMSSTAHQRQVADLKAAGLNPILAAGGGGSSTPGGAQGQMVDMSQAGPSAVAAKQQADMVKAQTSLMGEQEQAAAYQGLASLGAAMQSSTAAELNSAKASLATIQNEAIQQGWNQLHKMTGGKIPDLFGAGPNSAKDAASMGKAATLGDPKELNSLAQFLLGKYKQGSFAPKDK